MNIQEAVEAIKYIETLSINDISVGQQVDMVIKNQVLDIINQIDETQKPVVPQVAVDYYHKYKNYYSAFDEWFSYDVNRLRDEFPQITKIDDWLYDNDYETIKQRELALATLIANGVEAVEVMKEPLYFVRNKKGESLLSKNVKGDIIENCGWNKTVQGSEIEKFGLTEKEIKDFDERYWAFAVPVEDCLND